MLERLASKVTRRERIPIYKERANYYIQRAIINSIRNGVLDFLDDKIPGEDLVDPVAIVTLILPGKDQQLEFAFDENGLAFARVENGKYYPINLEDSEGFLKIASEHDKNANSALRRIAISPAEKMADSIFRLGVSINSLDDSIARLAIKFHEKLDRLEK